VPLAQLGDAGAMSRFIAALQIDSLDKSPRAHITRAHAAEGLGEVGNPAAIEPLLVALRDKKGDVRLAAAAALGKIGDVRAGEPLLAALRSEGAATEAELKGLERITAEAAADIRHRAALVRETAAVAIVRCADADLLDRLTPLLNDPDAEVRVSSARALGDLADRRAAAPLAEALEDEDSDVRFWAAQSLAKLGSARGLDELMEWLEAYDPAEEKQSARKSAKHMTAGRIAAAIHAVGLLAHAPALPLLADQLGSHTAELRMAAVEAIAVILRRSAARVQLEGLQALAKLDFPTIYQEPDQFLRFAKLSSEIVHLAAQEIERRERGEPEPESQSADAHEEKLLLTCGCGYEYELSMDFVGRRVRCPNCGEVFAVPAPAE